MLCISLIFFVLIYKIITQLLYYICPLLLWHRLAKDKEDPQRYLEKLGKYHHSSRRPNGLLIRIHGASIGETVSSLPLISYITQHHPDAHIMVTSYTKTSADLIKNRLADRAFHLYAPLDTPQAVQKFYETYHPDFEIILDSEIWPNATQYAYHKNIPIYGLNTRLSDKSIRFWKKFPNILKQSLKSYHRFFVQNNQISQFLCEYFSGPISINENLKWAFMPPNFDKTSIEPLKHQLNNRFVFCLLSTHSPEEIEIAKALVGNNFFQDPNNLLLIVPRHPHRKQEILDGFQSLNLKVHCRSDTKNITTETQIYLADTINEIHLWSCLSDIIFMGHSLSHTGGGHNPIEPAYFGNALCVGPKIQNLDEIYTIFKQNDACICVDNAADLVHKVAILKSNPQLCTRLNHNSQKLCHNYRDKLQDVFQLISDKITEIKHANT